VALITVGPACDPEQPASTPFAQLMPLSYFAHQLAQHRGLQTFLTAPPAECACPVSGTPPESLAFDSPRVVAAARTTRSILIQRSAVNNCRTPVAIPAFRIRFRSPSGPLRPAANARTISSSLCPFLGVFFPSAFAQRITSGPRSQLSDCLVFGFWVILTQLLEAWKRRKEAVLIFEWKLRRVENLNAL
jgi:hypothetical protein